MYLTKIDNENLYAKLILDLDFRSRPVLKIITINNFEKLMDEQDPKAENLMNKIWHGWEAANCDGTMMGYSSLTHVIWSPSEIKEKSLSLLEVANNKFKPKFQVNYSFQYRYRRKAIRFYFFKEFLCALVMLIIFQRLNYQYLSFDDQTELSEDCT